METQKINNKVHKRIGQLTVTNKGPVYNVAEEEGYFFVTPNGEFPTREYHSWGEESSFEYIKHFLHKDGVIFKSNNAVYSLEGKLFDYEPGITKVIASDPNIVLSHKAEPNNNNNNNNSLAKKRISINGVEGPRFHYIWDTLVGEKGVIYDATKLNKEEKTETTRVYLNHQPISPVEMKVARPFVHQGIIGWLEAPKGTWDGDCQIIWNGQKVGPSQGVRDHKVYSIGDDLVFKAQAGKLFVTPKKNPKSIYARLDVDWSNDFLQHAFINNNHIGAANTIDIIGVNGQPAFAFHHTDDSKRYCEVLFDGKLHKHNCYSVNIHNLDGKVGVHESIPNKSDKKLFIDGEPVFSFNSDANLSFYPVPVGKKFGGFIKSERYGNMETMLNNEIVGEPIPRSCYFPKHPNWGDQIAFDGKPAARFFGEYGENYLSAQGETQGPFKAVSLPFVNEDSLHFAVSKDDGTYLMKFDKNDK
tara:strand:- start:12690 stop:14105 length:1416 start_codon:yes stop_codon:yes gene_type:complete